MSDILVVDDEIDICRALELIFSDMGHKVHTAHNIAKAKEIIHSAYPALAFVDVRLGGENGLDLLKTARNTAPDMTVIMISAFGSIESAVQAMKIGAYDYICKPFINDEITLMVDRIFEHRKLLENNESMQKELDDTFRFDRLIGDSTEMKRTKHLIRKVLHSKANVLLSGDTGTGKSLVAHTIHHQGPRKNYPFVTINCGAIPENLMESELFGHRRGSFTGAVENKTGLFVKADKGTLFLDEVSELSLGMQVKLLNAIQTKEVLSVGATEVIKADVRILAASNRNLYEAMKKGHFREDLYYRLKVVEIRMPLLKECKSDIPQLVHAAVIRFSKDNGKSPVRISQEVMDFLQEYDWPGNVRELENTLERAVLMHEEDAIKPEDIHVDFEHELIAKTATGDNSPKDLKSRVAMMEKEYINEVLIRHNHDKKKAAQFLKINLATLYRKLDR